MLFRVPNEYLTETYNTASEKRLNHGLFAETPNGAYGAVVAVMAGEGPRVVRHLSLTAPCRRKGGRDRHGQRRSEALAADNLLRGQPRSSLAHFGK